MKKLFALTFILIFTLCFTGCGEMNDVASDAESMGESVVSGTESAADRVTSDVESVANGDGVNLMAKLSANEARDAALTHAKLEKSQVRDIDVDLERQNGKLVYEVTFESGNIEYDYIIDADTGEIISSNQEND